MVMAPDPSFWHGRRVLVTGHTGFKGSWLVSWLRHLGATVHGLSLPDPPTTPSLWTQLGPLNVGETLTDLAKPGWQRRVLAFDPEIVLHLAAQSLVSVGFARPAETFRSNIQGTVEVMELLAAAPSLLAAVIVTTDKVYEPSEAAHTELSRLGSRDPYAASKAAAELVVGSWPSKLPAATARAGNVIGGGDWATDRIVPDLVRAWTTGAELVVRMPDAVRPWQHVLEPIAGYLRYAQAIVEGDDAPPALNFGPAHSQSVSVGDLVSYASEVWRGLRPGSDAAWRVVPQLGLTENPALTLDSSLARERLGWTSRWDWRMSVQRTLQWYAAVDDGRPALDLTTSQIAEYASGSGRG